MAASPVQNHKFVNGETLEKIAKETGHRDGKAIWKAPENRAIVSKCQGKPENLKPGDLLFIPLTADQLKKLEALYRERDATIKVRAAFVAQSSLLKQNIEVCKRAIKRHMDTTEELISEMDDKLRGMKNWATGVDAAKEFISMGMSLGSLVKEGKKSLAEAGEDLAKTNIKIRNEAIKFAAEPLEGVVQKNVIDLKNNALKGLAFAGTAMDAWEKIGSPSFWANTYVQMTENGKTWSKAVTSEIGDDIEVRIKMLRADGLRQVKKVLDHQKDLEAQLGEIPSFLKDCDARLNWIEQKAARLGQ